MTHDHRSITDAQLERALGHRAVTGSDNGLLQAIVSQVGLTGQDRVWWPPFGLAPMAPRVVIAWFALTLVAALAVGALIGGFGRHDSNLSTVVPPRPTASDDAVAPSPRESPTRRPSKVPAPTPPAPTPDPGCGFETVRVLTGADAPAPKADPIASADLGGSRGAYLTSRSAWQKGLGDADLWVLPKGRSSSRHIATFVGEGTDLRRVGGHNEYALVGSSADESTWLVAVFQWSGQAAFAGCEEVFAIRTDGSPAVSLGQSSRNGPFGGDVRPGVLSQDGRRRAYVASGSVQIADTLHPDQPMTTSASCEDSTAVAWAPDGRSVAVGCDDAVAIVDDQSGSSRLVALPFGMMAYAIDWTDDGRRLLIGSIESGRPRFDLEILSIDISSGEVSTLNRVDPTSFEMTDTLSFRPSFSPDGRSLMVVGSRAAADFEHAVIYNVRTNGGPPGEVLDGYQVNGSSGFWWSRDGTAMAYVRGSGPASGERNPAELVREDLRSRRLTTLAALPDSYLTGVWQIP